MILGTYLNRKKTVYNIFVCLELLILHSEVFTV